MRRSPNGSRGFAFPDEGGESRHKNPNSLSPREE